MVGRAPSWGAFEPDSGVATLLESGAGSVGELVEANERWTGGKVATRHKVFVSFHEEDRKYRKAFAKHMGSDVVDKSVGDGDIDRTLKVDTTRGKIRDEFIADATVTVVLVGRCTWQRKYVDWEIGSSLRATRNNSRCGLDRNPVAAASGLRQAELPGMVDPAAPGRQRGRERFVRQDLHLAGPVEHCNGATLDPCGVP